MCLIFVYKIHTNCKHPPPSTCFLFFFLSPPVATTALLHYTSKSTYSRWFIVSTQIQTTLTSLQTKTWPACWTSSSVVKALKGTCRGRRKFGGADLEHLVRMQSSQA